MTTKVASSTPASRTFALSKAGRQSKERTTPGSARQRRSDPVVILVILLVVFMLATLGLLGYVAWQRGLIALPGAASIGIEQTATGGQVQTPAEAGLDPVALDPLQDLAVNRQRTAKPYRPFAEKLLASREILAGITAPAPSADGVLSAEQQAFLDQLNSAGQALISLYQQFEADSSDEVNLDTAPYQDAVSAEFASQSERITQLVGQVYGTTAEASHDAFLLPDLFKSAYAPGRRVSLTKINEAWTQAQERRVQRKLDAQHPEEIRQLTARLEALKEVHARFKAELDALPPYEVHAGNLGKPAIDALALLDSLMTAVEELAREHASYVDGLKEIEPSDTMQRLQDEFTRLAQEDHFFCFSEICRISVSDADPAQPAYDNLPEHYKFIGECWPAQSIEYLKVFDESERDWRAKWGKTDPAPPS